MDESNGNGHATNGNGANGKHGWKGLFNLRFDPTLTFGGVVSMALLVFGGIGFLMNAEREFGEVKASIRELGKQVEWAVKATEKTAADHKERIDRIERRIWRDAQ